VRCIRRSWTEGGNCKRWWDEQDKWKSQWHVKEVQSFQFSCINTYFLHYSLIDCSLIDPIFISLLYIKPLVAINKQFSINAFLDWGGHHWDFCLSCSSQNRPSSFFKSYLLSITVFHIWNWCIWFLTIRFCSNHLSSPPTSALCAPVMTCFKDKRGYFQLHFIPFSKCTFHNYLLIVKGVIVSAVLLSFLKWS